MKHEHHPEHGHEEERGGHAHDGHPHGHGFKHVHEQTANVHRGPERSRLLISMILTGAVMGVEIAGGILTNSLALISDAGHMFTHFFALGVSFFAIVIACRPTTCERSFGLYRAEILAAFVNGLVLLGVTVYIVYESVARLISPRPIADVQMLIIAALGLAVNLISALLLYGVGRGDLNVKSAFLHMVGDTLSSVAIVAGAVVIHFTGWFRVDPVLSALIAILIGLWSFGLLRDSTRILLEAAPKHLNMGEIEKKVIETFTEIKNIHDIHIWEITSGMYSMTAHVTVESQTGVERAEEIRAKMEKFLCSGFGIGHTTLQFETAASCCGGSAPACCTPKPPESV